jgi:hypothetical protein
MRPHKLLHVYIADLRMGGGGGAATEKVRYTVKKVSDFSVPSRDVTNQTLPGREKLN